MPDVQNTTLNWPQSLTMHVGPVQQTKFNIQVHGSQMTSSQKKKKTTQKLWHVNSVLFALSDNSYSVDLISQSTHYYRKQFLTATTFPSRLSTTGDPSLSASMAKSSSSLASFYTSLGDRQDDALGFVPAGYVSSALGRLRKRRCHLQGDTADSGSGVFIACGERSHETVSIKHSC